jgi:phosphatidate phosphatase APP1
MPPEELQDQLKTYNERHKDIQAPTTERPVTLPPPQSASTLRPPKRQDTASSIASTSSTVSKAAKITNVTYSQANLETLHDNLNARLRLFFSQKLVGRRIRVSIFLQPQESEPEKLIAKGTLMTELGGVFKSAICVPWQNGEPAGRKLRVRTELLTDQVEEETIDDQSSLDRVMARSDEASVGVTHAHAPIRVISDIDDTIKATHVLAGIKSVFRNVFTRPHEELTVDGMQQWYRSMQEEGACFHYVSNSPFELFGVLREYMLASGYPPGMSVRNGNFAETR